MVRTGSVVARNVGSTPSYSLRKYLTKLEADMMFVIIIGLAVFSGLLLFLLCASNK